MNIRAVLKEVTAELAKAGSPSAKLDAELILAKMLDHPREWLIANDRTELTASQKNNYDALIKRRLSHEPVSYINQSIEFYGLDFFVDKRVLSPRVETEMIVERTIQDAPPNGMVLDMGTGSGAIAIALCKHRPDLEIVATDISNDALEVARINAVKLLGNDHKIDFRMADIVASVPEFTKRTISMVGTAATTRDARSASASVGAPKEVPRPAAWRIASTTCACAWPRMSGPNEPT